MTAEKAVSLTTGNKTISGVLTTTDNIFSTGYIFAGGTTTGLRINGND